MGFSSMSVFKFGYWLYGSLLTLSIPFAIREFIPTFSIPIREKKMIESVDVFKTVGDLPFLNELNTENFLFAKATENYTNIHWLYNNNIKKNLYVIR